MLICLIMGLAVASWRSPQLHGCWHGPCMDLWRLARPIGLILNADIHDLVFELCRRQAPCWLLGAAPKCGAVRQCVPQSLWQNNKPHGCAQVDVGYTPLALCDGLKFHSSSGCVVDVGKVCCTCQDLGMPQSNGCGTVAHVNVPGSDADAFICNIGIPSTPHHTHHWGGSHVWHGTVQCSCFQHV